MAEKPSQVTCAECQRLWKDYADASLQRVRAYGNLKLANLRSDSETMEMLAEAAALANQKLEEVKRRVQEHESVLHWVVQRDAKTGALITFTSFVDYPNAERHMAELLEIVALDDQTIVVTIETLTIPQSPK